MNTVMQNYSYKNSSTLLLLFLASTTIITGLVLSTNTFADDNTSVVDQINITVPVSCTMSGTGMNSHNAEITNGTYQADIGSTTLHAFCNDNNGFAIYATGYTGDTIGGANSNKLVGTSASGNATIDTGIATSAGSPDVSNWAMKLAIAQDSGDVTGTNAFVIDSAPNANGGADASFNQYHVVPNEYTKIAHKNSATDMTASTGGVKLTTTYAAYVSKTQPADTYSGQVIYTLVHPADRVAPEAPLGLCEDSYTCMQQQTPASMAQKLPNVGDTVTLYDARDNQAYKVAKLADNKYWMVENLNIAGGAALSSEDTDFDSSYTLPTTGNWTVTDGKLVLPASATKNLNDNNLTDGTQFGTDNYAYVFNSSNKDDCGTSERAIPCYSYYSWDTATLGSGRTITAENTDAPYSICPKNWRLPTSGSTSNEGWKRGDFYALATAYGANLESYYDDASTATGANFYNNAGPSTTPDFLITGYYNYGSFTSGSSRYWSATASNGTVSSHHLYFSTTQVNSADTYNRKRGFSVRCLLSE